MSLQQTASGPLAGTTSSYLVGHPLTVSPHPSLMSSHYPVHSASYMGARMPLELPGSLFHEHF